MNLTVGPEPPAVYWRRRAIVAAPVLVILLTFTACMVSGGDDGQSSVLVARSSSPTTSPTPSPTPSSTASAAPGEECTAESPCVPPVGPPPAGTLVPTQTAAPSVSAPAASAPARPTQCANAELTLTAVPGDGASRVGEYPKLKLVVTNASARPCVRDVGATQQELRVMAGKTRVWSSDDCSASKGSDPRLFQPGDTRTYYVVWNSKTSAPGCKTPSTLVAPGKYQLLARVGNLTSKPAAFTISR